MEECELSPEEKLVVDRWMALPPPAGRYREILASDQLIEIPETSISIWREQHDDEGEKSRCYSCCLSDFYRGTRHRLWSSPTGTSIRNASCGDRGTGPHILRFVRLNQPDKVVQIQPSLF